MHTLKYHINKEGPHKEGGRKTIQNLINKGGGQNKRRFSIYEMTLNDYTSDGKNFQYYKQAVIKNKTKIWTEVRYFALKSGREEFVKRSFSLKLIYRGFLLRSWGLKEPKNK